MAFILEPASGGQDLMINGWNWRPLVAILVRVQILPTDERAERCLANGCGGYLCESEAKRAADYIDALLVRMTPIQRILYDGTVSDAPLDYKKPISEWDECDTWHHYSVKYDVLKMFAEFCRQSGGFDVL